MCNYIKILMLMQFGPKSTYISNTYVDLGPLTLYYFNVNRLEYMGRDRRGPKSTWAEVDGHRIDDSYIT